MSAYLECWIRVAGDLFHQALSGEPTLVESAELPGQAATFGYTAKLAGDETGEFSVLLETEILNAPLLGEGVAQQRSWEELLRETFEGACGELLAKTGKKCRIESVTESSLPLNAANSFKIQNGERAWTLLLRDDVGSPGPEIASAPQPSVPVADGGTNPPVLSPGLELLLDVELEASLRFGCREMPLGEILDLGPGDVVQLDRHVADPVDLIVGDKIVARGEVVLVNGNFGLRISEVAAPRKRLESIRCLF
jgi:flagellar motor switch protein FliN